MIIVGLGFTIILVFAIEMVFFMNFKKEPFLYAKYLTVEWI